MDVKEKLEKMEEQLEMIRSSMHNIDLTLVRQEEHLREHMRRSLLNEQAVGLLAEQMAPIKAHVEQMRGAGKLLGILALVASIISAIAMAL